MVRRLRSLAALVLTCAVIPIGTFAQPPGGATGTIEGRVFNAATGSSLANARVVIEGTTREVLTDETGSYRLTGVPAGVVARPALVWGS